MKFISDLFRKAAAPLKVAPNGERIELDELQLAISMHRSRLNALEAEEAAERNQLAEVDRLAAELSVSFSEGSPSSGSALDGLESKKRAIERRLEGLRRRIASLRAELVPQEHRCSDLAKARDIEQREEALRETRARCHDLVDSVLKNWRAACQASFELFSTLHSGMYTTLGSGPEQQAEAEEYRQAFRMLNSEIMQKILQASLEPTNQPWVRLRSDLIHHLEIMPGAPKKEVMRAAG